MLGIAEFIIRMEAVLEAVTKLGRTILSDEVLLVLRLSRTLR